MTDEMFYTPTGERRRKKEQRQRNQADKSLRRALQDRDAQTDAEARQREYDTQLAQLFGQYTDGASKRISKSGVRQRGMSDAQAAKRARQELGNGPSANDGPSTAAIYMDPQNPNQIRRPGRPLGEGRLVDPYNPTGFQSTGMDGQPGYRLRTEAERQARISESPLTVRPRLISSKRETGEVINSRDGDFNAEESRMYADRARRMGFGSAKAPGAMATAPAAPAAPKLPSAPGSPTMIPTARPEPTAAPTVEALNAARQANQRSSERARRMTGSPTMVPTARPEPTAAPTVEALNAARQANQRSSERARRMTGSPTMIPTARPEPTAAPTVEALNAARQANQRSSERAGARIAAPKTVTPDLTKTSSPTPSVPPAERTPTRPRLTQPWTGETKSGSYFSGMKPNASGRTYRPAGWTQDMENQSASLGRQGDMLMAAGKVLPRLRQLGMHMYGKQARPVTNPDTWKKRTA